MRLLGLLIVAACAASGQEDASRWIERLGSDSIEERAEASERLERLGPSAIEPIERALAEARDPEVRVRLTQLSRNIRKRAEFARVFGEVRRVTIDSQGLPLADVIRDLGKALGETIGLEGFDGKETVTLQLRNATLWQALDELARAGNLHYDYGYGKILLRKGVLPAFPVLHLGQFRVSVAEVKRMEHRRAGSKEMAAMIVLEVRHQRNMLPSVETREEPLGTFSVKNALGDPVLRSAPSWGGGLSHLGRPYALQKILFVDDRSFGPFTLEGEVNLPFATEIKEVTLPVLGEARETREDTFVLGVKSLSQSVSSTRLTLEARSDPGQPSDAMRRLAYRDVFLVDAAGNKHRGGWQSAGGGSTWEWEFEFPPGILRPQKVVFRWVREFKLIDIPFRLEGIRLPTP